MKLLKSFLFALLIGLSLTSAGCYMDDVAVDVEPVVVYRTGFGYGYWYNNYWYAAPGGFIYHSGCRPTWGPRYYNYAPRPYYNGGYYHGGYNGYHGSYGGYHGGYRGGGWRHR